MSLVDLVDNTRTDKNTVHSYLPLYESLLQDKKTTATTVLEIGIGDGHQGIGNGGSIKLWSDYFEKATVHAVECKPMTDIWDGLKDNERIVLHASTNAYQDSFVETEFKDTHTFDMILDDGPHTLQSMLKCIINYLPLVKPDGILIIEDVQSPNWIPILESIVPDTLKSCIKTYDLRKNKNRYDDLVFTVDKRLLS